MTEIADESIWYFGWSERLILSVLLLSMGALQVSMLEVVITEHAANSGSIPELTNSLFLGLLLVVLFMTFGAPIIRAGATWAVPRVREAVGGD